LARPDGRILAVYAKHGEENKLYYRISEPNDPTRWGPARQFVPSPSTRLTYANLFLLPAENGRIYDFFRGLDNSYKPSYVYSDDMGETWTTGNVVIDVPATVRHRPYVRYASNGQDTVHMLYTEGHPRDFDNSVYHLFYRQGWLHSSGGERLAEFKQGLKRPDMGTVIYRGDPNNVAWICDIALDSGGHPSWPTRFRSGTPDCRPPRAVTTCAIATPAGMDAPGGPCAGVCGLTPLRGRG